MNSRPVTLLAFTALCLVLWGQGCASSSSDRSISPNADWPTCPPEFATLSDALIRYRARNGYWPASLDALQDQTPLNDLPADWLDRVCYVGMPVGTLDDGGRLMLIDDHVREGDWVWTVTQSQVQPPAMPEIEIKPVPWADLESAAGQ